MVYELQTELATGLSEAVLQGVVAGMRNADLPVIDGIDDWIAEMRPKLAECVDEHFAELRKDKARLDWIEEYGHVESANPKGLLIAGGLLLRQTLDAAMEACGKVSE